MGIFQSRIRNASQNLIIFINFSILVEFELLMKNRKSYLMIETVILKFRVQIWCCDFYIDITDINRLNQIDDYGRHRLTGR